MKKIKVVLKKSKIGCTETQLKTLAAIGLKKIGDSAELADNPANRGQVLKVQHLVDVN